MNIFNLSDEDNLTDKINLDDLFEKKREIDDSKLTLYNKIENTLLINVIAPIIYKDIIERDLYGMIKRAEKNENYKLMQEGLDKFSRLNPKAYMTLLD